MSRLSTPLRAIPSTLATKSSPSIPSSSQTYEPLLKSILRHRLIYNIFLVSLAFSWIQTSFWQIWGLGGPDSLGFGGTVFLPFSPSTIIVSFASWAIVALPVILLKKINLTATRTVGSSPAKTVQLSLANPRTRRAFLTYIASAVIVTVFHSALAQFNEPKGDPRLRVFVKSRKHPYYLNGRLVFLLLSQMTTGCGFILRNVMLDRFVFRWPASSEKPQIRKLPFSVIEIVRTLFVVTLLTTISIPVSTLIFVLARMCLPILFRLPLLPLLLRPFTGHFLRGSWVILLPFKHFPLLIRAWFLAFTTLATWETSELIFDAFVSQPIPISHLCADPSLTLIAGVSSPDRTFKFFAYSELKELANDESPAASARRTALFGDQKYMPSLWSQLARESLLTLGYDYAHFVRRGKPPPPVVPAPAPAPPPITVPSTPISILKKPIQPPPRQSPIRTVIDSLASDGSLTRAVDAGADAAHIPDLFKSVEAAVLSTPAKQEVVQEAKSLITQAKGRAYGLASDVVGNCLPAPATEFVATWRDWWGRERVSKTAEACLPGRELDVLVIQVLSQLVCASLTEDRYGVVQRDTPRIIEAMLSFLSAIEEYQIEINALYTPPSPSDSLSAKELQAKAMLKFEVDKAGDTLGLVSNALKEGVADIVRTFGDKLLAFKFPPRIANKLQGFIDYA